VPLENIDLTLSLDRDEYKKQLKECQVELHKRARKLYEARRPLIVVAEGWDAAGKGGAIRRVTEKLDPRAYRVFAIAAPTDEELARHYLWRFWRRLLPPREKQIQIFDRSWYGRVLVERVEGFATHEEWGRAYREINDFERQLVDADAFIVKLWFHVSPDEQLRRFEARQRTPYKQWKLTDEDWRNRDKWAAHEDALTDMLRKTSTRQAPWTIIEGNDKRWARVKTLRTLIEALEPLEKKDD
jgi:polyphosphate kinase 2 (PPK2 family)